MSVSVVESEGNQEITIKVSGRFDFTCHQVFATAYKAYPKDEKYFVVDLAETEYMDSSSLGMLLQLKEHASNRAPVTLINGSEGVTELLRIANFDQLFLVE